MVPGHGGALLAVTEMGKGRPALLVHGFISTAQVNWIEFGVARALTQAGFRLILPDLRGHGESAKPAAPEAYPPDVLARDVLSLIAHFGLQPGGYDLVGYSLGARTCLRACVLGAAPGKLVLGGMGEAGFLDSAERVRWFIAAIEARENARKGSAEAIVARFLRSMNTDPLAAIQVMRSSVDTTVEELRQVTCQTLLVAGRDDQDNGRIEPMIDLLPEAVALRVPGDHMSVVSRPEFAAAIRDFLTGRT